MAWHSGCYSDLLHRCWGEEVFVFNPRTGHTHILNPLAWQLLEACATEPRSEAFLLELAAGEHAGDVEIARLKDALQAHLGQLQALDLIAASSR